MITRIRELRAEASTGTSHAQAQAAVGLIRVVLQHAALSLAEWVIDRFHNGNHAVDHEFDLAELRAPSDGTLVEVLLNLVVIAENLGWTGLAQMIWAPVAGDRPAQQFSTAQNATLESVLRGYVGWRNDDVFGHGLPNEEDHQGLLDVLAVLTERLAPVLPHLEADGVLVLNGPRSQVLPLKVLRAFERDLVCYRTIRMVPNGRCIVRAQRQLSLTSSTEVTWEADDILAFRARSEKSYSLWETGDSSWCPFVMVPSRMTYHFSGRLLELQQLKEWANDVDSRACMLYGDGGMGKTTLAVEFVHRLLDGTIASDWTPEMVTFYTAKQTRWGINGIEHIRASAGSVVDLAAEVYRGLSGKPADRTWFDKSVDSVVDKLAGYLAEWKIDRRRHLLIIDNTETMAADETDVRALASHVLKLARRVGRILITSRRREPIEAHQIEVPALAADESVILLRSRAAELSRQPILQAGDSKLRQIAAKLGNRPLTLEVFLQTLSDDRIGLDRALDRVVQMERKDLGEFLYTDAWRRFSPRIQAVLLLMTRVSDLHDEALVKLCCQQAGVSLMDAYDALSESRGIADVRRSDGHVEVVINSDFLLFATHKQVRVDGVVTPTDLSVATVKRRYLEFLKNKSAKVQDRISVAFRTPYARMAWQAFRDGRFDECESAYEMAVVDDPDNGPLFGRYAYALFTMRRHEDALTKANEATRLAPADAECWFTKGLIEGRLGRAAEAEPSLARATALGKAVHLCQLQLAYAFANASPPQITDAFAALVSAKQLPGTERSDLERRHLAEIRMLEYRLTRRARPTL
jgi:tetratricopeptide (TPR) repeat protein